MACQVIIQSWGFCRLVGAFLDLAIVYFLLCCSAVAFVTSEFLALFGLSLPCPCNGLFGYSSRYPCLQRLLVDCPTETISSLQLSVKTNFPFDSIIPINDHCQLNLKLVRERISDDGVLELEGEGSLVHSLSASDSFPKFDIKGKGAATLRPRRGLPRRCRASIDYGKFTPASSYDHLRPDISAIHRSPSDPSKIGYLENSAHVNYSGKTVLVSQSNDAIVESKLMYDNGTSFENLKDYVGCGHGVDVTDENAVRILELALEEEQAARAALCSELEQERLAATTAADEAMAMISRLQEEKASIEIEARQYQRILEEKSVYDAEEMDILKEIIVRREREKHFLEKEVEAYRKIFQENSGLGSQSNDTQGHNEASFLNLSEDPMLILQQLSESIDRRRHIESMSNHPDYSCVYDPKQDSIVSEGKESSILQQDHESRIMDEQESPRGSSIVPDHPQSSDEANQDIQEKGVLSMDKPQLCELSSSQGKTNNIYLQQGMRYGVVKSDDGEPHVHDVHIIDPKCSISNNANEKVGDQLLIHNNAPNVERKCELPFWASEIQKLDGSADTRVKVELDINRSSSNFVDQFSAASSSPDRSFVFELRRNSLSTVDHERLKIDSEIGWLRARLRAVQEEKEKLKSSLEYQERGKSELQLPEVIAAQLQEIRHLTEPEKAVRQASLPPLSSKITSKKRCSRGISLGVDESESS